MSSPLTAPGAWMVACTSAPGGFGPGALISGAPWAGRACQGVSRCSTGALARSDRVKRLYAWQRAEFNELKAGAAAG